MLKRVTITRLASTRGVTLIEVLVTLVVVALGLLGFVYLLNQSIVANREACLRTQASILAHDLTERMRANSIGARAGAYTMADKSSASGDDPIEWVGHLADALPEGDATVNTAVAGGALNVTVVIRWVDGGASYSFTTQTTI